MLEGGGSAGPPPPPLLPARHEFLWVPCWWLGLTGAGLLLVLLTVGGAAEEGATVAAQVVSHVR